MSSEQLSPTLNQILLVKKPAAHALILPITLSKTRPESDTSTSAVISALLRLSRLLNKDVPRKLHLVTPNLTPLFSQKHSTTLLLEEILLMNAHAPAPRNAKIRKMRKKSLVQRLLDRHDPIKGLN
jgi:hypothetical protein